MVFLTYDLCLLLDVHALLRPLQKALDVSHSKDGSLVEAELIDMKELNSSVKQNKHYGPSR